MLATVVACLEFCVANLLINFQRRRITPAHDGTEPAGRAVARRCQAARLHAALRRMMQYESHGGWKSRPRARMKRTVVPPEEPRSGPRLVVTARPCAKRQRGTASPPYPTMPAVAFPTRALRPRACL